jgi:hypothetical protein
MVFNLLARRLGILRDDPVTASKLLGERALTSMFSGEKNVAVPLERRGSLYTPERAVSSAATLPNFTFAQYAGTTWVSS